MLGAEERDKRLVVTLYVELKGVNQLSFFLASHVEFRLLKYDIAALLELLFHHVVLLEVFRGQGKGAQDIVRFVSHRVNEGVHLHFVILRREPRDHVEALEAAYPPFRMGEVERLGRGDSVRRCHGAVESVGK